MTGLIAHDEAKRLRSAIDDALGVRTADGAQIPGSARATLFRVVEVLEASRGAVVFPADAFVTTQQAAEMLGVSRMTVVRLIDRGLLEAESAGVHRRIAAAELERYRAASSAHRRAALRELADDVTADTPPDRVMRTR